MKAHVAFLVAAAASAGAEPCTFDSGCSSGGAGQGVHCSRFGACVYFDIQDEPTIPYLYSAGTATHGEAETICPDMLYSGRRGRLAYAIDANETARLVTLTGGASAYIDGSGSGGAWTHSNGTVFWDAGACGEGYCNWQGGGPSGAGDVVAMGGAAGEWVAVKTSGLRGFVCEFPCVDDSACGGGACTLATGRCEPPVVLWSRHREIDHAFVEGPMAEYDDAVLRCGYFAPNARLARIYYEDENKRIAGIKLATHVYIDGNDLVTEDTWEWGNGVIFWIRASGCLQAFCGWKGNKPDNDHTGEHHLSLFKNQWNDVLPSVMGVRQFYCEVPCMSDADCDDPAAGETMYCSHQGRCEYFTVDVGTDIVFAQSLNKALDDMARVHCNALTHNGLAGRLARVLSAGENARLATLTGGKTARMDGIRDDSGNWAWSDGTSFWDATCQQAYCNWEGGAPAVGLDANMGMNGADVWAPVVNSTAYRFLCEFPCTANSDCASLACIVATGRCIPATDAPATLAPSVAPA
eukprot:gene15311-23401_t